MSLAAGARISHYEILAAIGSGGMGEVYKAKDTRLDRMVAIKILRDVPGKAELTQRFEREARVIAALNRPHICTLYDVGRHNDIDYLVMEYVDGETLAHRLERGALPLHDVLKYAIEIADALDKAHRQGRSGDKMMAVDIQTKANFVAGSPRLLFEAPHPVSPTGVSGYDVSPDGRRFLRFQPIEPGQAATQINVVINWFEELKQRVPTAK